MLLRLAAFFFSFTLIFVTASAQQGGYRLSRVFTTADGLSSNQVYNCVEDNNGFLWIATTEGITRFDGRHFQVFTIKDGLPDNEVLKVVKEKNGTIWVNCFKKIPAYFDEVKNRFVIPSLDSMQLSKIAITNILNLYALPDGGVMYVNTNGNFIFKNRKLKAYLNNDKVEGLIIKEIDATTQIRCSYFIRQGQDIFYKFYLTQNEKKIDSTESLKLTTLNTAYDLDANKLFVLSYDAGKCYIYSDFALNPLRYKADSLILNESVYFQGLTSAWLNILTKNNKVMVFDKTSLQQQYVFSGNYAPRSLYNDSKGNIWIGTIDKGLLLYKKSGITSMPIPDNFTNTNFISIAKQKQTLLAGNFYREVIATDGKSFLVDKIGENKGTDWVRKIIVTQNKVFTFSEGGSFVNYLQPLKNPSGGEFLPVKTAIKYDDSTIIYGAFAGLMKLHVPGEKIEKLNSPKQRVTVIVKAGNTDLYFGSTDGVYKYDIKKDTGFSQKKTDPLLAERVIGLAFSADSLLWIATANNGVVVVKNDKVIKHFTTPDGIISNLAQSIIAAKQGQVWLGTGKGMSVINYTYTNDNFSASIQNLTINDGLCNNSINEMLFERDTVYAATGNGIAVIPAGVSIPVFDIPVKLTGVAINTIDTVIAISYSLNADQNNIELHFAGIELGGHFAYFQYRINNNNWQSIEGNTLNLQLNSGKHHIQVRAVDVNGNYSTHPFQLSFTIATPFWKTIWFWIIVFLLSGGLLFWFIRRRDLAKREATLQAMLNQKKLTELELQALKSQINPHFIFNCLNSIKYLNHQKKFSEAELYLDKFAALLRSALNQSSVQQISLHEEIEFIDNYLALEKLRFPDKLFYTIKADKEIDKSMMQIPSMLLQPYIENAVKHGIAHLRNRTGLIQVRFVLHPDHLIAEVEDNGNGIVKDYGRNGIGMKNTSRRSSLYNIETTITNLKETNVHANGTLVQLKIPLHNPKSI